MRAPRFLMFFSWLLPAAGLAQDISSLPGTYESVQRVPERTLNSEGIGPGGGNAETIGMVGQPVTGTLTIAADKTFTIAMGYFDEGTWEVLKDDKGKWFLRFTGKRDTFDAVFQGDYGLRAGEVGVWMKDAGEWWLVEYRKSAEPGMAPTDPYAASEAALSTMFGQGSIKVDFAEVAKGSASGVRVQGGVFSKGARFGSPGDPNKSDEAALASESRVVLTFLPDGRFTIQATMSGETKNGTYKAEGSNLKLTLDGAAEEAWEIGRDSMSGKFAIRPARSGGMFLLEVPLQ
jgi:hypothetical protein